MTTQPIKYNIVTDDGEPSSVTVFLAGGGQLVATAEHRNFNAIVDRLTTGSESERSIRHLFDVTEAVKTKMAVVSERVTIANGIVYFDHDALAGPLCDAILRFYDADQAGDSPSWKPLVAFLEKVMQNPNEHSRTQLFRWLAKHHYAICEDGDFIAYKGVSPDGKSVHPGGAFVNGVWAAGRVPNVPGTVIEMARSNVTFDPRQGCSTGLHVGNYDYAKGFASLLLRCKVNPRDVVSVPTDSGDAKVRTCRYYVLDIVTQEDRSLLYAGAYKTLKVKPEPEPEAEPQAEPKPASKPKAAAKPKKGSKSEPKPEPEWPAHYEDFKKADFARLEFSEMQWLAREWEVKVPAPRSREQYVDALNKQAQARRRAFKKANG